MSRPNYDDLAQYHVNNNKLIHFDCPWPDNRAAIFVGTDPSLDVLLSEAKAHAARHAMVDRGEVQP
jgi:hypothetical protein